MIKTAFTPAEIDTIVADLDEDLFKLNRNRAAYRQAVQREQERNYRNETPEGKAFRVAHEQKRLDAYLAESQPEHDSLTAALDVLEQVYVEAGRWARYFLCATDGGHVHHLPCHTLRIDTRLSWMPGLSGLDESGMIAAVGHVACTVCFPNAPVHPAWIKSLEAARKATAGEKLAKWQKGLDARQKKVVNAHRRLDKGLAKVAQSERETGDAARWLKIEGDSDVRYATDDLRWAKAEVERWMAKEPKAS